MRFKHLIGFALVLSLLTIPTVFGAETGTIKGKVIMQSGEPLPGVTITLEGKNLQGKRTTVTGQDGYFRFPIVPVGDYILTYELMGFATLKQEGVPAVLGGTTPIEATLAEARFEQEIIVTAAAPLIERDSGDLSTRLQAESLELLPSSDRTFRDIAKFVPGVTGVRIDTVNGDTKNGMPSFRGEGQYGNNYLVDGLSVRDPATKSTGSPLNFDAIEEVQIITDGFSPEYGRALGGTMNVLTKSGSNEFHGEVALQYESNALSGEEKDSLWAANNDFERIFPYVNMGGPILKDKLWFFISYNYDDETENYEYADYLDEDSVDRLITDSNLFAKLTFAFNPENTINVSGTFRTLEDENLGVEENRLPEALGLLNTDDLRVRINYKSIITDSSVLELKYGYVNREIDDKPVSGDAGEAQYREADFPNTIWGNYDSFDHMKRDRNDFSIDFTQFIDDFAGSHEFKAGLMYEKISSSRDLNFTGDDRDFHFDTSTYYDEPYEDIMTDGAEFLFRGGVPYRYYNYQGASVINETVGYGFYLQDKWSVLENVKVMLGFRIDTQDIQNNAGDTLFKFGMNETFSPRMTVAYDMTKDGRNVFKFGIGRFFDVASTAIAEWGNTSNPYSYTFYEYGGPGNAYTGGTYTPGDEYQKENWGRWYRYDDDGDGTYDRYEFHSQEPRFKQDPTHNPLIYSDDLKPYRKDEVMVGFDHGFGNNYAAKIRYIQGWTRDLIDDVNITTGDTDYDVFEIQNFDRKRRDYKAVETEFNGRPTKNLQFNLSYVWSDSKGTSPGQFELGGFGADWGSGNDVGVFGDRPREDHPDTEYVDLYGGLGGVDGDDGWYGPLPYAADHQVVANVTYKAPWDIIIGSSLEWNSGYHWQQRGWQDAYGGFLTFPEGRGAREMPSLYWWDVSISKIFEFGKNLSLTARFDIFNITDADKPVTYNQNWNFVDYNEDGIFDKGEQNQSMQPGEPNESFGDVLKRQDPRSARFTVSFKF